MKTTMNRIVVSVMRTTLCYGYGPLLGLCWLLGGAPAEEVRKKDISTAPRNASAAHRTNGNHAGSSDVGAWYITYYDSYMWSHGFRGRPIMFRPLCSNKPDDYRTYDSDDTTVMDYHLQQLADAKIDFLLWDLTNEAYGGYIGKSGIRNGPSTATPTLPIANAKLMSQRIALWNKNHAWKIRHAWGIGCYSIKNMRGPYSEAEIIEHQAKWIWDNVYNNPEWGGPDNYYQLNGKPLLVAYTWEDNSVAAWNAYTGDKTYGNRFALRAGQAGQAGTYAWNQGFPAPGKPGNGTMVDKEVELVTPGYFGGGYYSRENGEYYRRCWEVVLAHPKPAIVMIASFNDYCENMAVWTAKTDGNDEAKREEKWYGPDQQLHPSMYWDMTKEYIKKLREK